MSNENSKTSDTVEKHFFRASATDFKKVTGNPIAYWVSDKVRNIFEYSQKLGDIAETKQGLATTNNDLFLRLWHEVANDKVGFHLSDRTMALISAKKWFPLNKGGSFRRWYGNNSFVVDFEEDGKNICEYIDNTPNVNVKSNGRVINRDKYFLEGLTWSSLSSGGFSMRYSPQGFIFETKGAMCFPKNQEYLTNILAFFNSKLVDHFLLCISPTLDYHEGPLKLIPTKISHENVFGSETLIQIAKNDWNAYESSWDFSSNPLIHQNQITLKAAFEQYQMQSIAAIHEMQRLEQENNRIFIDAYGLQDELTPDVPLNEITLTCNPHYRYGNNKTDAELEALLLADTLKEFISYAVGCMFGRYALDKPGLILANQGETLADYLKQIPEPIFSADDDNVIPMLDGDWFTDDVTERFGKFLKVTFGEAHYEENLKYIEQALGKDIRKYFLKDFYNDHLKRYKKRPIYWLFSSPKGTFNALIYLHRYRSDTVSVVLNDYLREFRAKLSAHKTHLEAVSISGSASASEKTKALKDIENHRKMLDELDTYEREVLYPLATEQLEIDLDDGVKVNYQKFGEALKKIPGLAAKED